MDFLIEKYVSVTVKKNVLTKEVMNNYEKHFVDLNDDFDLYDFKTQEEKHLANIARYISNGEDNFIEGYGNLKEILEDHRVYEGSITKE